MAEDPITSATVSNLLNDHTLSNIDDDPFKDIEASLAIRSDRPNLSPRVQKRKLSLSHGDGDILGLSNEVKITKARQKIPKLDDSLLLSARGLAKLRKLSRDGDISRKLRLKGKGHEFSDAHKLLGYFQLWLDDLYPRAKFADALSMVEKAGHTKRMQVMRKEWIDEGKPGYLRRDSKNEQQSGQDETGGTEVRIEQQNDADAISASQRGHLKSATAHQSIFGHSGSPDELFIPDPNIKPQDDHVHDAPDDDDLDALLAETTTVTTRPSTIRQQATVDESEGEDDLDALSAEQDSRNSTASGKTKTKDEDVPENDDLDFLLAQHSTAPSYLLTARSQPTATELDDCDDLDTVLAEQDSKNTGATSTAVVKGNDAPEGDNLDAILAEQSTVPSRPSIAHPEAIAVDLEEEDNLDALLAEQEHGKAM